MPQSGAGRQLGRERCATTPRSDAIYCDGVAAVHRPAPAPLTRDVHAPSGWGGTQLQRDARRGAVRGARHRLRGAGQGARRSRRARPFRRCGCSGASTTCRPAAIAAQGQIGTTSFVPATQRARSIYVLGKENVDTDEYDASVIAHEWGHYYQSAFSRDDSPGGSHSASASCSTGGWPSPKAGAMPGRASRWSAANYTDSIGTAQAQGTNLDLTRGRRRRRRLVPRVVGPGDPVAAQQAGTASSRSTTR